MKLLLAITLLFNGLASDIIPMPACIEQTSGTFNLAGASVYCDPELGKDAYAVVEDFSCKLSSATGKTSQICSNCQEKGISFILDASMAEEEYSIRIDKKRGVTVKSSSSHGVLWAVRSLQQMLPPNIYDGAYCGSRDWTLQCGTIGDSPRFRHRGLLLDCSRHFFSVEEVKKVIDVMSIFKLNRLHWHLTDDQGWRIEIKKYPRLTEIGAVRRGTQIGKDRSSCDNIPVGGYYTQDQIRDIVHYASVRGVEIMPEIDLPGHMLAALASYPSLGCTGGPYDVWTHWGISDDTLCPGKEETFTFLEAVLGEVADLFPCEYFHIGGDECPTSRWTSCHDCQRKIKELGLKNSNGVSAERQLQGYVARRVCKFLESKGKKVVCWDEVLQTAPPKNMTIMVWSGIDNITKGVSKGYDVIACSKWYCYLDYAQAESGEPEGQTRVVTLDKIYRYDPADFTDRKYNEHIIGVQANLWAEYLDSPERLEYMLLPRMIAASEIQWCRPERKDFGRFCNSLRNNALKILDYLKFRFFAKNPLTIAEHSSARIPAVTLVLGWRREGEKRV